MADGQVADAGIDQQAAVLIETIRTSSGHVVGHATLNAPTTLNALTMPMIAALDDAFDGWLDDPTVVAILIDGAGDRAFCAGGDVSALYRSIRATPAGEIPTDAAEFFAREYRLDYRIHAASKPVLSWGHGIVMGGGIGLHAGASHRVVTPKTRMAMPEISIGLYPDVGGSWFLARAPGRTGLFLALTGASINASDAVFVGLADFIVDHGAKTDVLSALAAAPWTGDARADAATLSALLDAAKGDVVPPAAQVRPNLDLIDETIGHHDRLADIAARLSALTTHADPWIAAAATNFAKGSPTSVALVCEIARRARHLSLADVFRLEYDASVGCCLEHDFAEGVRALLIDKDKTPHWVPPRLDDVDDTRVARHFAPRHVGPHPLADLH